MRLSLPSVAILSIFAASSHAFAPPSPACSVTSTRLNAGGGSELSGLLNEYSGSAATQAVSTTAAKVAAVSTPPPPPVAAAPAESGIDSLMKAASVAQDAADQAAAAAAAVAAKGAAATKAAAVAGTSVAGGVQLKPIVGGVLVPPAVNTKLPIVQVDPAKINYDNAFDASARAKENIAIIKGNFMSGVGSLQESSGVAKGTSGSVSAPDINLPNIGDVSLGPAVADIIAALHLKEYGGWYAAAAMALIASQQRTAGMEDASAEFESELAKAQEKAGEAASAAGLAAEGAKTAKQLAMKMEKDMKKGGGEALLESSRSKMAQMERVSELQCIPTSSLFCTQVFLLLIYPPLFHANSQKDIMEKEMQTLRAEVASLRSQLQKAQGGTKKAAAKTQSAKTEIEEAYPTKVIVDAGLDEDGRIIELLKEIDEDNKKKKAAELEKKREEEAKFVAAQKSEAESRKMTKGVEAAQAKAEVAKKRAAKKKSTTKKSSTKKTAAKKKTSTKTKSATKAAPKKAATSTATASADDWALLAESTLKRKTVAQLTEYLSGKVGSIFLT